MLHYIEYITLITLQPASVAMPQYEVSFRFSKDFLSLSFSVLWLFVPNDVKIIPIHIAGIMML